MNIKMRYLTIIAVGMLLAANITASDDKQAVGGAGGASCGKFIADTKDNETLGNLYFSGHRGIYLASTRNTFLPGQPVNTQICKILQGRNFGWRITAEKIRLNCTSVPLRDCGWRYENGRA